MKVVSVLKRLVVVAVVAASMTACVAQQGAEIPQDKVADIKDNVTTRSEIEKMFGQSEEVSMDTNGNRTLVYRFYKAKSDVASWIPVVGMVAGGTTVDKDVLQVLIDKNGIVRQHELTSNTNVVPNNPFAQKK